MRLLGRSFALALLIAVGVPVMAMADRESDPARLRGRVAPEVAQQVLAIAQAARDAGLPSDPLVARALEGSSRHAEGADIVADVRRLAAAQASARDALAPGATAAEVVAGASALLAGVPADTLAHLRSAHRAGSLVIPIVVLCDFVARGVPVSTASSAVLAASRAGTSDDAFMRLRERIHDRIEHGSAPAGATQDVMRQWLKSNPAARVPAGPQRSP